MYLYKDSSQQILNIEEKNADEGLEQSVCNFTYIDTIFLHKFE